MTTIHNLQAAIDESIFRDRTVDVDVEDIDAALDELAEHYEIDWCRMPGDEYTLAYTDVWATDDADQPQWRLNLREGSR